MLGLGLDEVAGSGDRTEPLAGEGDEGRTPRVSDRARLLLLLEKSVLYDLLYCGRCHRDAARRKRRQR